MICEMKKHIWREIGTLLPGTEFWYQEHGNEARNKDGYLFPSPDLEEGKFRVKGQLEGWPGYMSYVDEKGNKCKAKKDLQVVVLALVI